MNPQAHSHYTSHPPQYQQDDGSGHRLSFSTRTVLCPEDGDAGRLMRGMGIAALVRIEKHRLGYRVHSLSGRGTYIVNIDSTPICSCPDFDMRQRPCKHIYAVLTVLQREEMKDGGVVETATVADTPQQGWSSYNAAQEHEQEHFAQLLRALCDTIEQPPRPQGAGRPRLPLSDMVFGSALKVYSTMSTRRAMTDMRNAQAAGMLDKTPSTASTWRCMEDPGLTPVLEHLIQTSALPLRAVEHDFAIDSTAFATSVYHRWFDHKWNKMIKEATWVKAHALCGVKTNIITVAEATAGESADSKRFAPFVEATARHFSIHEVSADKAYLSKNNLLTVEAVGGIAYIPFKSNSNPTNGHHKRDTLWERAYHFYHLNRAEFLQHYHKRSNVETTFAMVKAKFGPSVRSKMPSAQVNEVLLKFLCHNIAVLIHSAYELGVEPVFAMSGGDVILGASEQTFPVRS